MEDTVSQTKAEFTRAKDRLAHALATTPDDKINWSPSATCRTPVQQVAHAAIAVEGLQGMFMGKPFPFASLQEMDEATRKAEKQFTTREQALGLIDDKSAQYLAWLDTLTPAQLESTLQMPFGPIPMAVAITIPADHARCHAAQIDYIQTVYGDLDWHLPT